MYCLDQERGPEKGENYSEVTKEDGDYTDDNVSRQLAESSHELADQQVNYSKYHTLDDFAKYGVISSDSILFSIAKKPGESHKDYLERLWTAKIRRVNNEDVKGDCVALRDYFKTQKREIFSLPELLEMAEDELGAMQEVFSNEYFDKMSPKTFVAFLVNEMIDKNLEAKTRVHIYRVFLFAADVAKIPSGDQVASFGLAQTVKETYYWLKDKYDARLPPDRRLPDKFKYCIRAKDQVRVAVLLAYENIKRIGEKIDKIPALKKLFDKASPGDQQLFLTGLLARAHNAGVNSAFKVLENLKYESERENNLKNCLKYLYINSEIEIKGRKEKKLIGDGNYAKGAMEVMVVL